MKVRTTKCSEDGGEEIERFLTMAIEELTLAIAVDPDV